MASRYGGITGTEQIANDYQNINIAFENVEADVDAKAAIVSNHINDNVRHVTEAEHTKLASVQPGAEPNQNAFSRVNGMDASTPTDELTIVGDVGVTVTQNPNDKSIHLTVTGESAPGPHAATHLTGGIDPIPVATGTTSGLMPPESFQAIADNTEAINDITAQLAETVKKGELVFDVRDYGAVLDGETDDTQALRDALSAAESVSGIVFIPPTSTGMLINVTSETIVIPFGVTLTGISGRYNGSFVDVGFGSTLLITGNEGNESGTPMFTMRSGSRICRLNFVWPDQVAANPPVAYPYLVANAESVSNDCTIEDIYLHNCYQFADFTRSHFRPTFNNIYGDILRRGIVIDKCWDVPRINNVHFWPFFDTSNVDLRTYRLSNAVGIELGHADNIQGANVFGYGLLKLMQVGRSGGQDVNPYGEFVNVSADICKYGIECNAIEPNSIFTIKNFRQAMSDTSRNNYGVSGSYSLVVNHASGILNIDGINVWGGPDGVVYTNAAFTEGKVWLSNINVAALFGTYLFVHTGTGELIVRDLKSSLSKSLISHGGNASRAIFENPSVVNEGTSGAVLPLFKRYMAEELVTVASAATVALPVGARNVKITGTTAITNITPVTAGARVTLIFTESLTVNTTGNIKLSSIFNATANDTLTLISDGTNWLEISRSAN